MQCSNCQKQTPDNSKFCRHCGNAIPQKGDIAPPQRPPHESKKISKTPLEEKFFNLIIVSRPGLGRRWWHRLANVLICGSTIIILALLIFIFVNSDSSWKKYDYVAYSFESNYKTINGQEENCSFSAYDYLSPSIYCGDIKNSTEFLNKYTLARGTYEKLTLARSDKVDDDRLMTALINEGDLKDVKTKKTTTILYDALLKYWLVSVLVIVGWFIFWESIIYRTLIYIILGSKANKI